MAISEKVLFVVPYPLRHAPSQRFRVELFLPLCENRGLVYDVAPFWDEKTFRILYQEGRTLRKAKGLVMGFARRLALLFKLHRYQYVFLHREAAPIGPPLFEWAAAKLWRKKIIYDFDDAIWISDSSSRLLNALKAFWKIRHICRWSYKVAAGNEYLCRFAARYNNNVVLLPTCVDTLHQHNRVKDQHTDQIVIGWTGSHSTLKYLDSLVPLLQQLAEEKGICFLVICNQPPAFSVPHLSFRRWNEASEIDDLMGINIGIMPLQADKWSEGKCGFKIIQYLSLGIPAVASPVGVNSILVEEGVNGFLCRSQEEWSKALNHLISSAADRAMMGAAGRKKMVEHYSTQANEAVFFDLFS